MQTINYDHKMVMKDFILRTVSNPNRKCYVNELIAALINITKIKLKTLSPIKLSLFRPAY